MALLPPAFLEAELCGGIKSWPSDLSEPPCFFVPLFYVVDDTGIKINVGLPSKSLQPSVGQTHKQLQGRMIKQYNGGMNKKRYENILSTQWMDL